MEKYQTVVLKVQSENNKDRTKNPLRSNIFPKQSEQKRLIVYYMIIFLIPMLTVNDAFFVLFSIYFIVKRVKFVE